MRRFKTFAAASVLALSLAAPAFAGTLTTFATTTDVNSSDITWTDNGTSGTLNTSNTTTGDLVNFQFEHIAGLQSYLQGNLTAYEKINNGLGVTTTAAGTSDGVNDSQSINSVFSISYTLATPINVGGMLLSNLLTATVTPNTASASITGTDGGSSATLSASTNNKNVYTVSFTSDFLKFQPSTSYSISLAFNSVTPDFELDNSFISSFVADLVGSFAANPAPTSIPEVPSAALLIIGMAAVGVSARRRAAAAASV
jgi:hypothetical protein